ncbi:hypothetical protein ABE438_16055 [Bosea sp. TWI1241]|uniref:hypothetical protein n=1 Tax=Bosea sp. TWI1241 TaxID=3148904 RepID=UPI0032093346
MVSKGRIIGVFFGLFALACLFATYDFSRGRTVDTDSALIGDVLTATTARECGRDATEVVAKYLPEGMAQGDVEALLAQTLIRPPQPWFWKPVDQNTAVWSGESLEVLRTIKTTAFGNQLLRIYLSFSDGKLRKQASEVICRFD